MAVPMIKNFGDIETNKTVFFMCDMQERFRPSIEYFEGIVQICSRLVSTSNILNIPLVVTEQYPKALGNTVSELDTSNAVGVYPKTKFSMLIPAVEERLGTLCGGNVKHVVLFGIETHVCIQQTAIDLLKRGIQVYIIADAVSSRFQHDRLYALERLRHIGATVTTSESILFQLLGDKDHSDFKAVQALVKEKYPDTGLLNKL
ncbi:isochorismatase domain-containing protein 1-like [Lineus longissimus]|uniref:isochorismatase domain-containing protein 1-like n=1 Tax=Lineus longissimus TaxID=88925 RepID=UPI00315D1128